MTERQKAILEKLIREYVKTAEPVSSGFLVGKCGLDCSPATIRAEMFQLEKDGYLRQPHTSAGREPTDKAYRYMVNRLMGDKEEVLPEKDRKVIDRSIQSSSFTPHALSSGLARAISGLTNDFVISGVADTGEYYRLGFSNILEWPEWDEFGGDWGWGNILDEFEDYVEKIFDDIPFGDPLVFIGRENPATEAGEESIVVARYGLPQGFQGVSAVIGPRRMNYDRNMAILKYVAKRMNELIKM